MRLPALLLAVTTLGATTLATVAQAEPIEDRQRAAAAQLQAEQQRRIEIARERCLANRGTDCDTLAGLSEFVPSVFDRLLLAPAGSASAGGTVAPDVPDTSPRHR